MESDKKKTVTPLSDPLICVEHAFMFNMHHELCASKFGKK